ncbi:hypothetical protein KIL84_020674 [Mauremys mutica]|uniref:Uncharacterized protein n=1 Tax=Mauremys mutica TaxID=74926 RepID=A0A9D3XBG1_9SAUR|nr:hypothetical protein KIL84_020674 [Mauremys mutica]
MTAGIGRVLLMLDLGGGGGYSGKGSMALRGQAGNSQQELTPAPPNLRSPTPTRPHTLSCSGTPIKKLGEGQGEREGRKGWGGSDVGQATCHFLTFLLNVRPLQPDVGGTGAEAAGAGVRAGLPSPPPSPSSAFAVTWPAAPLP